MSDIFFIENTEDWKQLVVGRLSSDGKWVGDRQLELDVRQAIRSHNLDLQVASDRQKLLAIFGGSYLFAIESESIPEGMEALSMI